MDKSKYIQVADRYLQLRRELEKNGIYRGNASHIIGNLVNGIHSVARLFNDGEKTEGESRRRILQYSLALKTYLRLLDEYPEFKTGELEEISGYFPNMKFKTGSISIEYVLRSRELLQNK